MFTRRTLGVAMPTMGFAIAAFVCSQPASAVTFTPRVSGGYQDYALEFQDVTTPNPQGGISFRDGFRVSDRLGFLGAGLNISSKRIFVDLSAQRSARGTTHTTQFQGNGNFDVPGTTSVGHIHSLDSTFRRDELNATLGWGVTSEFSLYAGFKHAKLDMQNALLPLVDPPPQFGELFFFGTRAIDFHYNGPFLGATYAVPVGSWGALSIQSSVAFLDGGFKEHFNGLEFLADPSFPTGLRPIDTSDINGNLHGRARGLNLGVSWTGSFGGMLHDLSYTVGLDRSEYTFKTSESTTGDFTETNTRLRLDLRYRFSQERD